jgi:Zn-dependent peptidase ImmA (M78 family)/DNA-binding XRE family transcriptional regulator
MVLVVKVLKFPLKSKKLSSHNPTMPKLTPSRLRLARKRRGLTKIVLADKARVDRKMVGAYESGESTPSDEVTERLAAALEFPLEFFFGDDLEEPSVETGSFRAMTKMRIPQRDMALSQAALGIHFSDWLSTKFSLPPAQISNLGREPDPEMAAEFVRREWQLGSLSIRNMIHLLESKGVRVFSLAVDAREVDAFSIWKGVTPFVFLNTHKTSEHSRFDAAHELGHLVLHKHGPPQGIEAEKQANAFASAFLMHRGSVIANAPRFPTYDKLVNLKRTWTVSVSALAYRLHSLGLMTDWQYRGICIEIAKRGRDKEPNEAPREASLFLPKMLGVLYEDGITRAQIARELAVPVTELEQLLFGLTMTGIKGGSRPAPVSPRPALTRIK